MSAPSVRAARFDEMSVRTFHDIVRLRVDTFVVEQGCAYAELDGRDALDSTEHLRIEAEGHPISYLRIYRDDGITWIGRVVTARDHRRRGLGALLMRHALRSARGTVRVAAQAQLEAWYARFGFERCGPDHLADGIPHTPMWLVGPTGSAADDAVGGDQVESR